jgi:prepilin-type N-terminal cleavage/methylation domain-containing protein
MGNKMKREKGFTLLETVISLALLVVVAVAFMVGMTTASNTMVTADERATAESIARRQMEYVKEQPYVNSPSGKAYTITGTLEDGYTIKGVNRGGTEVAGEIYGVPWNSATGAAAVNVSGGAADNGLQRVRIIIYHHNDKVLELVDYKIDRKKGT